MMSLLTRFSGTGGPFKPSIGHSSVPELSHKHLCSCVLDHSVNQGVFSMKTALAAMTALLVAASPVAAQTTTSTPLSFADKQSNSEMLGTDFIGTPVTGKDGQQLGKISNLVFGQE